MGWGDTPFSPERVPRDERAHEQSRERTHRRTHERTHERVKPIQIQFRTNIIKPHV